MPVEPREQVTCTDLFGQPVTGGAGWCRRKAAAFVGGTSRVSREAHARICERLGVKFPGPTRHVYGDSSAGFQGCDSPDRATIAEHTTSLFAPDAAV